jgi:hypothetical protein
LQAALLAKSQHCPALPFVPLLLIGAPRPAAPPLPGVPGVKVATIGAVAGVLA